MIPALIVVDPLPAIGVESTITVTHETGESQAPTPGLTVRFVFRDGLPGEHEIALGITDGQGSVKWTPGEGGAGSLVAGTEQLFVGVDRSLPSDLLAHGVVIAAVAAVTLALGRRRSA